MASTTKWQNFGKLTKSILDFDHLSMLERWLFWNPIDMDRGSVEKKLVWD